VGDHSVVVVGASAGGVEALQILVANPPRRSAGRAARRPAPACRRAQCASMDPGPGGAATDESRRARRPLKFAHITIAPSDQHLLVHEDMTVLSDGPREHHHRPAVDPLFRSAARWHRDRVIGVILSGALNDGAAAIALGGGIILVQDPDDSAQSSMPRATLTAVPHAQTAPVAELGDLIARLVMGAS
jgi:two-component system chemotaxis response regulator CheB